MKSYFYLNIYINMYAELYEKIQYFNLFNHDEYQKFRSKLPIICKPLLDKTHEYQKYEDCFDIYHTDGNTLAKTIKRNRHRWSHDNDKRVKIFIPKKLNDIHPNISGNKLDKLIDLRDSIQIYNHAFELFTYLYMISCPSLRSRSYWYDKFVDDFNSNSYTYDKRICIVSTVVNYKTIISDNLDDIYMKIQEYNELNKV